MSDIEWTGQTWNPVTGCDRISRGCDHCYALTLAKRLKAMGSAKYQTDGDPRTSGPGFGVALHDDVLTLPIRWRKPTTIFVNSMSDLFHAKVPKEFVARAFATMGVTPRHTYQILTKRPERMQRILSTYAWWGWVLHEALDLPQYEPFPTQTQPDGCALLNVWLGTSIESDEHTGRADRLRETPAAVRFVSAEPLLGPLPSLDLHGIDWLIIGGESGKGARPLELAWVYDLIDRARDAKTAVFVKQLGSVWARDTSWGGIPTSSFDGKAGDPDYWPADLRIREYPSGGGA
jgi:protein gp37